MFVVVAFARDDVRWLRGDRFRTGGGKPRVVLLLEWARWPAYARFRVPTKISRQAPCRSISPSVASVSNMAMNPTVSRVTRLANCCKPRAARPAGYRQRYTHTE